MPTTCTQKEKDSVQKQTYTVWLAKSCFQNENKKAQLTQRERATAVHVWRPTANKC